MEVGGGPQNQIGRVTFDDDAGLVAFGTELRGDHHQVSNWAPPSGYRQASRDTPLGRSPNWTIYGFRSWPPTRIGSSARIAAQRAATSTSVPNAESRCPCEGASSCPAFRR